MYFIIAALLIIIFYLLLPIGLGMVIYKLTLKISSINTAKIVTVIYTFVTVGFMFTSIFEEDLFSESDAEELIEEHGLMLEDEFELVSNQQASAISEYFHYFTLDISDNDKNNLIEEIKNSPNFKNIDIPVESLQFKHIHMDTGPGIYQNFETETDYVREYFKPNGKGYAPTFKSFSISKTDSSLQYEDL